MFASGRDRNDTGAAASSSHPQPQRGAEALSNFYGRSSSDPISEMLDSRAEKRRSSYMTTDTSHGHGQPVDPDYDMDDSVSSRASSVVKGPRVYSSFSAAVAAASRSSLNNRRGSQPMSEHGSPIPSSPRPGSIASHRRTVSGGYRLSAGIPGVSMKQDSMDDARSAYHSTGSHGMERSVSGTQSPPLSPTKGAFDRSLRHSVHGLDSPLRPTPEQIRFANSWLATDPTVRRDSQVESSSALSRAEPTSAHGIDSSPDVSQYSTGKGFGWSPAQTYQPSKTTSKPRLRANSKTKSRSDSISKAKTSIASTETFTPEPSVQQQRLSTSGPAPSSIADELGDSESTQSNKPSSAFARFGRAFRRRSKSGSEAKSELKRSQDSKWAPPVPPMPTRQAPSPNETVLSEARQSTDSAPLAIISAQSQEEQALSVNHPRGNSDASVSSKEPPSARRRQNIDLAKPRPMSTESTTSTFSAHRTSMAFLASAISTGHPGDHEYDFESVAESEDHDSTSNRDKSGATVSEPTKSVPMPLSSSRSSSTRSNLHNASQQPRSGTSSRTPSGSKLLPKSATRDDQVPSILSDFLSMDLEDPKKTKIAREGHAEKSGGSPVGTRSIRSASGNSDARKGSASAPETTKEKLSSQPDNTQKDPDTQLDSNEDPPSQEKVQKSTISDKARKVRSHSNLRVVSKDGPKAAVPRASLSLLPTSRPSSSREASTIEDQAATSGEPATAKAMGFGSRLLRRPKTSSAAAGSSTSLTSGNSLVPSDQARRGSGAERASVDGSLHQADTDFELLTPQDSGSTPKGTASPLSAGAKSGSTDLSSMLETRGGAAGLFGTSPARTRTASLIPSFGFGRGKPSPAQEGASKPSGNLGNRSTSTVLLRESADLLATPKSEDVPGLQDYGLVSGRASGVSSGSRPSFNRQHSTNTILTDNGTQASVKAEPKFSASAFLPYDDEGAEEYAERMAETAPKNQLAALLASSNDEFYIDALRHCMSRFWFNSVPLDIALRKLLMDLHLPKETQQIDRVMEAFATRYNECNSGLFKSVDQPYILAFSLMLLHSDAFNKNAKVKMTKGDYLRNTAASGVPNEILEYLYDNLTFTQFIYVEDEDGVKRNATEALGASASTVNVSALPPNGANAANRQKLDPYFLIASGRLGELRPDLELLIPEDTPFSNTGSLPSFDVERLNAAFLHAPSIEIVTTKASAEQSTTSLATMAPADEEVVSLKITKVGIVNRKDDVSDGGKKAASRKWKTSGLLLTGSQLLIFKDVVWIGALQSQIVEQVGHSLLNNGIPNEDSSFSDDVDGGIVITPRITYFRPDGVISLIDAVAVKENTYGKYSHVFRLVAAKGRQYLVQAQNEDDMNDWIHKINFCATFRTVNIKIRGPDMAPRAGVGSVDAERSSRPSSLDRHGLRSGLSQSSLSDADQAAVTNTRSPAKVRIAEPAAVDMADTSIDSQLSESSSRPGSESSLRTSPATSGLQKRANARKEMMLLKIGETETDLERIAKKLQDEIRLARHFAILTPFLKSTRERIELSALPLSERIRDLRLQVAKADSRCKILRLDLAAGESAVQRTLPPTHLASSALRLANKVSSSQLGSPPNGGSNGRQAASDDLFGTTTTASGISSATAAAVTKPASHQRHQMNLNAVSERPADEASSLTTRSLATGDASVLSSATTESELSLDADRSRRSGSQARMGETASPRDRSGRVKTSTPTRRQTDEVPEDWDLSQVARKGANRISLVKLPSPTELQQATGKKFLFSQPQE